MAFPCVIQLPAIEEMFAALEKEQRMIPDRLEKIDELSVRIVVDFDSTGRFSEENTGGASKDLDIDFVRWEKLDEPRGQVELPTPVGKRGHSLLVAAR